MEKLQYFAVWKL